MVSMAKSSPILKIKDVIFMLQYGQKIRDLEDKNKKLEEQKKEIMKKISANKKAIEKLRDERLLFEVRRAGFSDEKIITDLRKAANKNIAGNEKILSEISSQSDEKTTRENGSDPLHSWSVFHQENRSERSENSSQNY